MKTEEKIEELRQKLHEMILQDKYNMDFGKILEMSRKIDKHIVRYVKNQRKLHKNF